MTQKGVRKILNQVRLLSLIEGALDLVTQAPGAKEMNSAKLDDVKKHIQYAERLCNVEDMLEAEPIRTIHHFSCTGGTLLTKCIASMANTLVLNEIDLQSNLMTEEDNSNFTPSDIIALLRQGDRNISGDLIERVFLTDLEVIREEQWRIGRSLVLRDHCHSHFLIGDDIVEKSSLLESVKVRFPVKSIVTVRDPVDSYLSMHRQGWHKQFHPSTFEEYCRRYLAFLEIYATVPIVKYEDFVKAPAKVMQQICTLLVLDYFQDFQDVFDVFRFSGDSGRKGDKIMPRPRQPIEAETAQEIVTSTSYKQLVRILDYQPYI